MTSDTLCAPCGDRPRLAPAMRSSELGAGFGGLALSALLAEESTAGGSQPARAAAAAFPAEGEAGHHALHVRRPVAPRHLRSQAAADARQRPAAAAREAPAGGLVSQSDGQPRRLAVRVPPARRERALDQLVVPAPGAAGRRPLRDQLDALLQLAPRRCRAGMAHRQRHVRPAQHGLLDHLWAREREPELSRDTSRSARTSRRGGRTTSARGSCPPRTRGRRWAIAG